MLSDSPFSSVKFIGDNENSGWIYLLDWVLALVLALSFIFYSGRLAGFVISLLLRLVVWKRYKVLINIDSLRFSPLGGRIFAKHVTLITENQTISMLKVTLTWRYWMLGSSRVSEYKIETMEGESDSVFKQKNEKLPTRFDMFIEGLEVFMYNRTAAYENIESILKNEKERQSQETQEEKSYTYEGFRKRRSSKKSSTSDESETNTSEATEVKTGSIKKTYNDHPSRLLLSFLPLGVRVKQGVIVLGNVTTPTILMASYKRGVTIVDINKAPSSLDAYRQLFNMDFDVFQVSMKHNLAYDGEKYLGDSERRLKNPFNEARIENRRYFRKFNRLTNPLSTLFKIMNKKAPSKKISDSMSEWKGLERYVDGAGKDIKIMDEIAVDEEYAKYSLIMDTGSANIIYYYDIPGESAWSSESSSTDCEPEFGIHVELSNVTIHYGPWAEKQRFSIQNMFFPTVSRNTDIELGKESFLREYAGFLVTVYVRDELILRIPTREASKDKEDIRSQVNSGNVSKPTMRPFGWLELKVTEGSSISSFFSFIPDSIHGWKNTINLDFLNPELRTSVNHDILFMANSHCMDCDIGFPLIWNDPCHWNFISKSKGAEIFFLREHSQLVSDLFTDFASGQPTSYEYLRRYDYSITWSMEDYKIYFNVNDSNIINNPLDFNGNKFISFQGKSLDVSVFTSFYGQLSKSSEVEYCIFTPEFELILDTPPWHTTNAFLKKTKSMGKGSNFKIEGVYHAFRNIEINTSDHIVINSSCDFFTLKFYGFLVKYFFIIRENYLGDHTHFKTYEEYKEGVLVNEQTDENSLESQSYDSKTDDETLKSNFQSGKIVKTVNDVDILLSFNVNQGLIILPYNLYDCSSHIGLVFDSFNVDTRFNNYYSNLQADFSDMKGGLVQRDQEDMLDIIYNIPQYVSKYIDCEPEIMVEGFTIHAHRMFGIPPQEITYYCKWDFMFGDVKFDGDGSILGAWDRVASNFAFGFKDVENALSYKLPTLHDASNFSLRCPRFSITTRSDNFNASMTIVMDDILINFNDISNNIYSTKLDASIPKIELNISKVILGKRTIVGKLKTGLFFSVIGEVPNSNEFRDLQQALLKTNDAPFHRIPFLISREGKNKAYHDSYGCLLTSLSLPVGSVPLSESSTGPSEFDETFHKKNNYVTGSQSRHSVTSSEGDSSFKVDSFICDIDEMEIILSPHCLPIILSTADNLDSHSLGSIMDEIQIEVVKEIWEKSRFSPTIENFRFYASEITLKYIIGSNESNVLNYWEESFEGTVSSCTIQKPSIVTSKVLDAYPIKASDFSMAFQFNHLYYAVSMSSDPGASMVLNLHDFELWLRDDKAEEGVGSLNIEDFSIELDQLKISWLHQYFVSLREQFSSFFSQAKKYSNTKHSAKAFLVQNISKGGLDYNIDFDPAVLTKPAYVLRANEDQVRFWDKWKVITRLRHILDHLPQSWIQENEAHFEGKNFEVDENAIGQVTEFFSNWRNWESNIDDRLEFFKSIFKLGHSVKDKPSIKGNFEIKLINFAIKIASEGSKHDLLSVHNMEMASKKNHRMIKQDISLESIDPVIDEIDVVFNCSSLRLNLPDTMIETLSHFREDKKSTVLDIGHQKDHSNVALSRIQLSLIFNFESIDLKTYFGATQLYFHASKVTSSFIATMFSTMVLTSSCFSSRVVHQVLQVSYSKHVLLTSDVSDTSLIFAGANTKAAQKILDVEVGKSVLTIFDKSSLTTRDYVGLFRDFELTKQLFTKEGDQSEASNSTAKDDPYHSLNDLKVDFLVHETHMSVGVLNPIDIIMIFFNSSFSFVSKEGIFFLTTIFDKSNIMAKIGRQTCLEMSNSNFVMNTELASFPSLVAMKLNSSDDYTKFWIPNLKATFDAYDRFVGVCGARIEDLKVACRETLGSKKKQENEQNRKWLIDLDVNYNYFGVSTSYGQTKLSYDVENIYMKCSNVVQDQKDDYESPMEVPMYGVINLSSTNVSVSDRVIPVDLSRILSFNILVKLVNEVNEVSESAQPIQSIQIESQYFRACFSPTVLMRLVAIFDEMSNEVRAEIDDTPEEVSIWDKVKSFTKSTSIHILSYNFSLGWLFNHEKSNFAGIMLGSEQFFATIEEEIGKFTLVDTYLSMASKATASTFYDFPERKDYNRALLPKIQLLYTIETENESKMMKVTMNGDELDVKFLSTSYSIIESLVTSSTQIQDYFSNRSNFQSKKDTKSRFEQSEYIERISSSFSSVELVATFAGSNVMLYRLNDGNGTPSSLFLQSPAVKIATIYQHQKFGLQQHLFKAEILTSSSNNILQSNCVPVIMDLVRGAKMLFRKSNDDVTHKDTISIQDPKESSIGNLLNNIDIHIGIRIDEQRLCLSCDPKAKVEAIVGIEGIDIQVNTDDACLGSLVASVYLEGVSAILQHIYSREISGSFSIKSITSSSFIKFSETTEVVSAAKITDVDGFINVKQYQDIDLFKDIWIPAEERKTEKKRNLVSEANELNLHGNKSISTRFKEVSTSYAIPWVFTLMIYDVKMRMDFGQSLGDSLLSISKIWAISKKSTDWSQDLKIGIRDIELTSQGRLGGLIEMKKLYLHFGISWKSEKKVHDVPLITLSFQFETMKAKLLFDYHVFAIASLEEYSVEIFNQKNEESASKDRLVAMLTFKSTEIYLTSLSISTFMDIYISISRMVHENRKSYKETLFESSKGRTKADMSSSTVFEDTMKILETVKKLETHIDVYLGKLLIQVYPASFEDTKVMVLKLNESRTSFQQNEYVDAISNEVEMQFNNLKVSLSATSSVSEDFVSECSIDEFTSNAHKAFGGTIFVFPSFMIYMKTFQKYNSKIVDYVYHSSFGGTVDVRWNLGSINFIREMQSVHQRACISRLEYMQNTENVVYNFSPDSSKSSSNSNLDALRSTSPQSSEIEATQQIDKTINDTLDKVSNASKYIYQPLSDPVIEAPQLKELGNATPPLEWFGLHREKFPDITHSLGIVGLQKLNHEIEKQYSRILGKA